MPFLTKWPFKFAQECPRMAFLRRPGVIVPPGLRRAPGRADPRKRPLRPQLRLCLAAKPALLPRAALHEAVAGQTCAYGAGQTGILKRPGNGHAQPAAAPYQLTVANGAELPRFTPPYKRLRRLLEALSRLKRPFPLKSPLSAFIAISGEMAF